MVNWNEIIHIYIGVDEVKRIWLIVSLLMIVISGSSIIIYKNYIKKEDTPKVNAVEKKINPPKETSIQIKSRIIKKAKTPRFHELKKNPLKYKEAYVIYTGGVAQAYENKEGTYLLLAMSDRGIDELAVYIPKCYGSTDVVEGDIVKVYGRISKDGYFNIGTKDKPHEVPCMFAGVVEKIKNGGTVTWR
jgi:hypothetical protein